MDKKTAAVILAGGRGKRLGTDTPKQYLDIGGHPLVYYSLATFSKSFVDEIVLVCGRGDEEYCSSEIVAKYGFDKVRQVVCGGAERYHSVYNGLKALGDSSCDIVYIHDGARPFISEDVIRRTYDAAVEDHAAVAAIPANDTVKLSDEEGFVAKTLRRDSVWLMQTPQVFYYNEIYAAYHKLIESEEETVRKGILVTDDAMVLELFSNRRVKLVSGDRRNIKITTPEDLMLAEHIMKVEGC